MNKTALLNEQPTIFIGHGSPMHAISSNRFTQTLREWGKSLLKNKPKAILVVSAHWLTGGGTFIQASNTPEQIYDFGAFPKALFDLKYPAKGSGEWAQKVAKELGLKGATVAPTLDWGVDHGSWCVLVHLFPDASIPVFELSIDPSLSPIEQLQMGERLADLKKQGVLVMASGNIVHNLSLVDWGFKGEEPSRSWAKALDSQVKEALLAGDQKALANFERFTGAKEGIATSEHFVPLLYALGASKGATNISFPFEGFDLGTLSMRAVQWD